MLLMQASSECIYLWGGNIHFRCICLPNFAPLLMPIALIYCVMSGSVDRSSVTCGNVISDADLRDRQ